MANKSYMQGRYSFLKGGTRPQAMLWSRNPGVLENSFYVPSGIEGEDFIIISDHNRSEMNISQQRLETRKRMVNGNMRSHWIADKLNVSCSWSRLPSRAFDQEVGFSSEGQPTTANYISYTVDGAAGGADMVSWYENTPGSFYLFLSYDKNKINGENDFNRYQTYAQILKVYFSSFDYSVEKRSGAGFDFWNISLAMEEV